MDEIDKIPSQIYPAYISCYKQKQAVICSFMQVNRKQQSDQDVT